MIRTLLACLIPVTAMAGGDTLVHQGRLVDVGGAGFDGQHSVTFTIYAGTQSVWSETDTVDFADGYYATVLGDGPSSLHDLDFANTAYSLGITVDTSAELTPRTPFTSVVTALTGPVNVSDNGVESPCTPSAEGTIRYRGGLQVCDGTSWSPVGNGGTSDCSAVANAHAMLVKFWPVNSLTCRWLDRQPRPCST